MNQHHPSTPRHITSPWTGATVRPVIRETRLAKSIRKEAYYTCPNTGRFITKIVLEERPLNS